MELLMLNDGCGTMNELRGHCNSGGVALQSEERLFVWFLWFLYFVWFFSWFKPPNETNQINQTNRMNRFS
jgi:hypothetical protein